MDNTWMPLARKLFWGNMPMEQIIYAKTLASNVKKIIQIKIV
jgi:hypothetical protein